MNLRRAAGLALAGVGATALANRALHGRAGELEAPLAGEQRTYRWRGMDVAYTEAGDPDDPDLVLLHGINAAGSSGEFREVFSALADEYHVVAPDLPGFGLSDRPPLRYSAALYEDFVADFLGEFDSPRVLASSLTSAYVVAVANRLDLSRLVLVCPTARGGPDPNQAVRELVRAPVVGDLLFNAITSKPSIRYFNADHGYYDMDSVTDDWMDYEWRTAHQPNARFAPASFISGYLNSEIDLGETLAALDVPVTLVWGREADITPLSDGRKLADEADARLVVFDDAKLLPHVEHPGAFLDTVREELAADAA
ncbi:Pimeloyl-ACP methyl ester carboxylesterase [Halogranum gelatinilyticum]|uniref:Pimeloyl-ACP methyl ester carboxylesterase n=1 Tax=Halogranum gelatinilyticum TaxID=660521 RepID=A0A1G9QPD8_9EURY|nr:alpha/beta hydrolase [Halogranum gelatinilyticum]SDM12447.1 Pimeloyl-ACP methyl ester carboxylesterase [Halogranum gelatinilyticum]